MRADRELCVDRSRSRLVEAGSVESAFVLVGKGQEVAAEDVKRLGLRVVDGRVVQGGMQTEPEAAPGPAGEMAADSEPPAPIMPPESRRPRGRGHR